jgi:hypothetical protein
LEVENPFEMGLPFNRILRQVHPVEIEVEIGYEKNQTQKQKSICFIQSYNYEKYDIVDHQRTKKKSMSRPDECLHIIIQSPMAPPSPKPE